MKKALCALLSLVMLLSLTACGGDTASTSTSTSSSTESSSSTASTEQATSSEEVSGLKIAYSVGYVGNAWRSQLVSSLEEAADAYLADGTIAEFQVVSADNDSTTQISQCNAMLAEGLDALLICAVSPTTLASVVATAQEMGTMVILSCDPAVYEGTYCVVNDAYGYSMLYNEWFVDQVGPGADVVYISGNPGNGTDMIRDQAVYDAIEEYGLNLLAEAPGKRNQAESQSVMTSFLSAYPNIQGVLSQNVTTEGVFSAYNTAGKEMPPICGDTVLSTVRMWAELGEYESIGVTNSPAVSAASLHFAVLKLQGYELQDTALEANPLDDTLINSVLVDPPVAITLDGTLPDDIMANYPNLNVMARDEVLELYAAEEDTFTPDVAMSRQDTIDAWFIEK